MAGAPGPIGPYSVAVEAGPMLFLSGQGPIPSDGSDMPAGIEAQTKLTMENLKAVLTEAGLTFNDVVKTSIFLTDMADFSAMNAVYAGYFESDPPARTTVGVAALPKAGMRVEIDMVAIRP